MRRKEKIEEASASSSPLSADVFVVKDHIKDADEKDVATKSDVYHKFQVKKFSLDLILRHPTKEEVEDQNNFNSLVTRITRERELFEDEMERVDDRISTEKTRLSLKLERIR